MEALLKKIPVGYHNIDMGTWKDKYKNMMTKMSISFSQRHTHTHTHTIQIYKKCFRSACDFRYIFNRKLIIYPIAVVIEDST